MLLAVLVLGGCGVISRPAWQSEVMECASTATITDYQEVHQGWEKSQFEVAYVGPPSDDPMELVQAPGMRLEKADGSIGRDVFLAEGSIRGENSRCLVYLSRLDIGPARSEYLNIDENMAAEIARGEREVLELSFIRYRE
ncbi:hypothetical protein [Micromonospora phaseoli]|nr:hypothetical protein [Micromonospora phaseoli]